MVVRTFESAAGIRGVGFSLSTDVDTSAVVVPSRRNDGVGSVDARGRGVWAGRLIVGMHYMFLRPLPVPPATLTNPQVRVERLPTGCQCL